VVQHNTTQHMGYSTSRTVRDHDTPLILHPSLQSRVHRHTHSLTRSTPVSVVQAPFTFSSMSSLIPVWPPSSPLLSISLFSLYCLVLYAKILTVYGRGR
jgi:hypothetical protein